MAAIREYILGLTAAAMLCGITLSFAEKGPVELLLKLICGLILTFCLTQPLLNISLGNWQELGIDFSEEAEEAALQGSESAEQEIRALIKQETEAYILDKARQLNLDIKVEVTLSREAMPIPESVVIRGTVQPYQKSRLSLILTRELGIRKENQKWIS